MDHIPQPIIANHSHALGVASKATPIVALVASGIFCLLGSYSQYSATSRQSNENAAQIEQLKSEVELHQRQLDQEGQVQEQLKDLNNQTQVLQQDVREISDNLREFEDRFLVVPSAPKHSR